MVKFLLNRPIAVFMAFLAFFILGVITYLNIPVSLLPDISIPEITVQISGKNRSARELENTVVSPIRQQLLQVGRLRDINTETRDGNAIIRLKYEYGIDTDLAFIEVNEKIDAAMNYIPRDIDRPRVIKASATDIPVFNLNLTLKDDYANTLSFIELSEFAEANIKRHIEQLPSVAMVDITGVLKKQIIINPDKDKLSVTGIKLSEIESALLDNNVEPGAMVVRDGYYEYNIKFLSILQTIEDIENIYIRKNDKILQIKDLAEVSMTSQKEKGIALFNGKQAVVLSVIKQSDENMSKLQKDLKNTITQLEKTYPVISFDISQNQTELLNYTISNLLQNLILAFIFVCLVSAIFMRDVKSPVVIGLSMFVSLVISLLFFYLFHVSLNIISLTGLILALGMMVDNSIIVTDNIGQYRKMGFSLDEACVKGTNEVITPMLTSAFTTICIFVPLVFMSGIAGAIFYDQAFAVTVGLLVSYITAICLLPVLYKLFFSIKRTKKNVGSSISKQTTKESSDSSLLEKLYHKGLDWTFSHKLTTAFLFLLMFPLCYILFVIIPKEKIPDIKQNEFLLHIEWNENIHVNENKERTLNYLSVIKKNTEHHSALIAQQQFLLNNEQEQTSSESQIYLKTFNDSNYPELNKETESFFRTKYPKAVISFAPAKNIFNKILSTEEPDLVIECYANRVSEFDIQSIHEIELELEKETGERPSGIPLQNQLCLNIDQEKLSLYKISYNEIYQTLKTGLKENEFSVLRSFQEYLPIVLGNDEKNVQQILNETMVSTIPDKYGCISQIPLSSFISVFQEKDLKSITGGRNGEYVPFEFTETKQSEQIIRTAKQVVEKYRNWDVDFSGSFFTGRKMINELIVVLLVSILLMYFILVAQFEDFKQPLIILSEIPIDIAAAIGLLYLLGHSLNLMSAIGIIVTCGIVINDSILKIDIINQLRKEGYSLMESIYEGGRRRLNAIVMTSLTTIVCMAPLLFSHDIGAELEKPLAIATIGGMIIGMPVSLFIVPLMYWWMNRKDKIVKTA